MHVPIHNHSEYSALDGLSTINEIADRCVEIGCPCCGLTDHGTVAGHLELSKVLTKRGIKPIFGCELYHGVKTEFGRNERDAAHLVGGAMTDQGLRNLWSLVDESASNFRYVSRVNWDMLSKYSEGMFATSACIQGLVAQGVLNGDPYDPLNRYLEIYGDNFFIEIHTYPDDTHKKLNLELVQIAEERGIPLIYASDAHFANPDQYELHDAYIAKQTGQSIYTPIEERKMWHPKALYILDEQEIRDSLSYLPEWAVDDALNNSADLGEKCNATLPEVKRHLPVFKSKDCPWLEKDDNAADVLMELVVEGIQRRYGDASDEVWDRAMRELEVFVSAGLEHYFLLAWDLVQYCKDSDIEIGPGRGSAAGCLVAYVLGITDVDPLAYDLIFERFFNAGREDGFPDIDMDFPRAKRKDILHYLERRWGKDNVRSIGTITRMKPKAVIDKTHLTCGITYGEAAELKAIIDEIPDLEIHGVDSIGWSREQEPGKTIYVEDHVGEEIREWVASKPEDRQDALNVWLWFCEQLCSRASNVGIHPSGVVVSDVPLPDELPCRWNNDHKMRVTMFPMDEVDKRKFIKMDILGLRTLDTLTDWKAQIHAKGMEDFDWSGLEWTELPEEMWSDFFDTGRTLGLFQIEDAPAVRKLAKEFRPRSVTDCSILVALNRPGPLRAGKGEDESTAQKFVKRRNDVQPVTFPHPFLEDILAETYGLFLYQEQVIAFFNKMNYSLSDSDAVRKILGKKKPEQMRDLYVGKGEWVGKGYMTVAPEFVGDEAEKIWETIVGFASYSFNKSHSVAYGTILFRTAFAKYYGTTEYEMACVRTDEARVGKHIAEARRMGISVLPPDILGSSVDISADEEGNLVYGFSNVKGVGKEAGELIVSLREAHGDPISTRDGLEGALEAEKVGWKERQAAALKAMKPFKEKSPNMKLKSNQIDALQKAGAFDYYEERIVTLGKKQEFEKELLGVILSDDSSRAFANNEDKVAERCDSTYEEVNEFYFEADVRYTVPGVIVNIKDTAAKSSGKKMGIVTIEYGGDEAEFVVFPQQYKAYKFLWKERAAGIFTLRRTARGLNFEEGMKLSV